MCRLIHRRTLLGLWQFFWEWRLARNRNCSIDKCPENLFEDAEVSEINRWVSHSIREVRRKDGQPYLPQSIHQIFAGLQRFTLSEKPNAPRFLDRKDPRFRDIHGTCDTIYRKLHQQGIGAEVRHAAIITVEEEDKLWATGEKSPTSCLLLVGKHLCI